MRPARTAALGLLAAAALLLAALVALPLLLRDRIAGRVKAEIDRSVNARVAWAGVGLDVLRDFPDVTMRVRGATVVGVAPFAGDTLLSLREARLVLDLRSVLRHLTRGAPVVVREVALDRPAARLRVLADGRRSWDVLKPGAAPGEGRAVAVTLRDLRVAGGSLVLDDRRAKLRATVHGLEGSLRGDFGRDRFTLATRTRADSVSVRFAGVPYLGGAHVSLVADVDADTRAQRFRFRNDTLRVNALALVFGGTVVAGSPNVDLDLAFSAPSVAFKDLLSLVPAIYRRDFEGLQASGRVAVTGRVRGAHGPAAFPAFAVRATVSDGAFRYPSLALPARDIQVDLLVDNPGGDVDRTVVDLRRFHATLGGRPIDARLVLRTPVTDPDVDFRLAGSASLADVARAVKLEGVTELSGLVSADVAMRARLSDVDARRYERVAAGGTASAQKVVVRSTAFPRPVAVDTLALRLTPRAAEVPTLRARVGGSDVRLALSLDNLLGFALRGDELRGTGTVASERFDLKELVPAERTDGVIPVPARIDFSLRAAARGVTYGALSAANVRGGLRVKDRRVTLDSLRLDALNGAVVASGYYETVDEARPAFHTSFRLDDVDVPAAFAAVGTVQRIAPIARWARGTISGTLALRGTMDARMAPELPTLTGAGEVRSERLSLEGAPPLERVADALSLDRLRNPAIEGLRATFTIADGRVGVRPFTVGAGGVQLTVGGSHGMDQSMSYDLALAVPRALLGGATAGAVARLASLAGRPASELARGEAAQVRGRLTGTVASPRLELSFAGMAASLREAAVAAVREQVASTVDVAKARADSAAEGARRRARAEAERVVAEAERQAEAIRAEARAGAARVRAEAGARADSLAGRATNPVAKVAAQRAAERLKREADGRAERLVREADARADALVAAARARADAIAPPDSARAAVPAPAPAPPP